ncbi:unnamed protein product [Protopolystoma xenopodis]|uniref:Uncharacterized protein n=1 Tax=Protopolystoma xenopodis TaxID=117903 RepID=A0A3S5CUL1_9PLAT|nr:unnamed protein product [Protopolystoma xenopodis]
MSGTAGQAADWPTDAPVGESSIRPIGRTGLGNTGPGLVNGLPGIYYSWSLRDLADASALLQTSWRGHLQPELGAPPSGDSVKTKTLPSGFPTSSLPGGCYSPEDLLAGSLRRDDAVEPGPGNNVYQTLMPISLVDAPLVPGGPECAYRIGLQIGPPNEDWLELVAPGAPEAPGSRKTAFQPVANWRAQLAPAIEKANVVEAAESQPTEDLLCVDRLRRQAHLSDAKRAPAAGAEAIQTISGVDALSSQSGMRMVSPPPIYKKSANEASFV